MSKQVVTKLVCDLCGNGAEAAETVTFGTSPTALYEFEVCEKHAEEFRSTIQGWQSVARRAEPRATGRKSAPGPSRPSGGRDLKAIREWARANGHPDLSDRGRIPAAIVAAYEAAQGAGAREATASQKGRRRAKKKATGS